MWPADGYTFIHSDRSLTSVQEKATRNEGVRIAFDKNVTAAWKNVGDIWKAVNYRAVMARLKQASVGMKHWR